ncbi:hypothetical protein LVY75_20410 [Sinorhizobium sp. B11]
MENEPSPRVLDQRVRNRIIEVIGILADGVDGLRLFGVSGYFNFFFDWVADEGDIAPNSAMSIEEREQLMVLRRLVVAACDDTPATITEHALIETGWLDRIVPEAQRALEVFLKRGRFDEEKEELEPSA